MPPTREASTGTSQLRASMAANPNDSISDGNMKRSAMDSTLATSVDEIQEEHLLHQPLATDEIDTGLVIRTIAHEQELGGNLAGHLLGTSG